MLEVLVVIPAAVLAGMAPVPTALVAVAGNLGTVALVALAGDKLVAWWRRRRPQEDGTSSRRLQRGRELAQRWGVPGLAFLAPLTTGSHVGTVAALATGADRRRGVRWMAVGVSVAADVGVDRFGVVADEHSPFAGVDCPDDLARCLRGGHGSIVGAGQRDLAAP